MDDTRLVNILQPFEHILAVSHYFFAILYWSVLLKNDKVCIRSGSYLVNFVVKIIGIIAVLHVHDELGLVLAVVVELYDVVVVHQLVDCALFSRVLHT